MAKRGLLHLTRKPTEENVKFRSVLAMLAFRVEGEYNPGPLPLQGSEIFEVE